MQVFARQQSGSVAVIFAVSAVLLMGSVGAAIDYGRAYNAKSLVQSALDSAVMQGVTAKPDPLAFAGTAGSLSKAERIVIAQKSFQSNLPSSAQIGSVSFVYQGENLVGTVTAHIKTTLLAVLGVGQIDVSSKAGAATGPTYERLCFMAMNPTRKHTLELSDSVSVYAPDCHIYGNSSHIDDVVDPHSASTFLTGRSVQAIGYGHNYLQNVSPPLEHAPELIADPFATKTLPTAGPCMFTNKVVAAGATTLTPGTYCGGLTISSGADVTLAPGIYVIVGGTFLIQGATVSGSDVTIALADDLSTLEWRNSQIVLAAPNTGPYASMVLTGVRLPTNHVFDSSTIDLHGVVYLVDGAIDWINVGTPVVTAKWTAWIVDGVSWSGSGTVNINFKPELSTIPYPAELLVIPRPGKPRVLF